MKPLLVTGVALVLVYSIHVDAQSPSIKELIPKATAYVHSFLDRFTNVVAEGRYEQEITSPRRKRVLGSGFVLVAMAVVMAGRCTGWK